jgi:hypothetical protein
MLHYLLSRDVIARLRNADDASRCAHYPKGSLLPSKLGLHEIDDYIDRNEDQLPELVKVRLNGRPFDIQWNARTNRSSHRQVVKNALRAGATLEIGRMEARHPLVGGICAALEGLYGGRASGKVLVTPHDRRIAAARFDAGSTFIVQLLGTTPWSTYGCVARHPTPAMARLLLPEEIKAHETTRSMLHTGDVLFIPPGVGHAAESTQGHAVHAVFNVVPLSAVDLLQRAIEATAPTLDSLRAPVYPGAKEFQVRMEAALTDAFSALLAQTLGERLLNFSDALHPVHASGRDISISSVLGYGPCLGDDSRVLMVRELVSRGLFNESGRKADPPAQDPAPGRPVDSDSGE